MKNLFSPERIGNVQIKNRLIRSATFTRRAEKGGNVGDPLIKFYSELAEGGVGLIITGLIAMDPSGSVSPSQMGLYDDSFIPGQKKLVKAIHDINDTKICAQIAHSGRQGMHPKYPNVGPSPIFEKLTNQTPRELKPEEIKDFNAKFAETAERAYECGYDMVQLHSAHGYYLSNFLSPYTNIRQDEYGGTTQKRTKVLLDIFNLIRDKLGKNFPITIKLQVQDFVPQGLMLDEGKDIVKIIVDAGYDAIEPSGGLGETLVGSKSAYPSLSIKTPEEQNYFLPMVKEIKPLMEKSKLILMGGIRNPITADKFIEDDVADFISMGRPFLFEPDLPNRWKSGDISPAKCISCNSCYMTGMTGPTYCVARRKQEKRRLRQEKKAK